MAKETEKFYKVSITLLFILGISAQLLLQSDYHFRAPASVRVEVKTLGSSYKGKYVGVEHSGIEVDGVKFVKVELWDMWKNKLIISKSISSEEKELAVLSSEIKNQMKGEFSKYNISL